MSCRRAAAASFQENVGRQGNFPYGIEIITEADYFTLAVDKNAYMKVGLFVAQYKEYFESFVEHLSDVKLAHISEKTRLLAAGTLASLVPLNPEYFVNTVLPKLVPRVTDMNLSVRHGAVYGVSEILLGLGGMADSNIMAHSDKDSVYTQASAVNEQRLETAGTYMTKFNLEYDQIKKINNVGLLQAKIETYQSILEVVGEIETKKMYRGKGGDSMRIAVCRFIESVSKLKFELTPEVHRYFRATIDTGIQSAVDNVQTAAINCFEILNQHYNQEMDRESIVYLDMMIWESTKNHNFAVRRGYSRALGCWSKFYLTENCDFILAPLTKNCILVQQKVCEGDVEARKFAIESIVKIFCKVGTRNFNQRKFQTILDLVLYVLDDYTSDRRGDVGSIVREAGMYGLYNIMTRIYTEELPQTAATFLTPKNLELIIGNLLQQLVEKIDKTRLHAGSILQRIFDNFYELMPNFSNKAQ